jgi:hypothetical protein
MDTRIVSMNEARKRIGTWTLGSIFLLLIWCTSCRTAPPDDSTIAANRLSFAADYWCPVVDFTVRLKLKNDGTYELSEDNWGKMRSETGTWSVTKGDIVLQSQPTDAQGSFRRLRPDPKSKGGLVLVEPDGKANKTWPFIRLERE